MRRGVRACPANSVPGMPPMRNGEFIKYHKPDKTLKFRRSLKTRRQPTVHDPFAEAIRGGKPYVCPGEQGLQDLAVCLAMAESARTGGAVDLEKFIGGRP